VLEGQEIAEGKRRRRRRVGGGHDAFKWGENELLLYSGADRTFQNILKLITLPFFALIPNFEGSRFTLKMQLSRRRME
jgi:hypothetical protein